MITLTPAEAYLIGGNLDEQQFVAVVLTEAGLKASVGHDAVKVGGLADAFVWAKARGLDYVVLSTATAAIVINGVSAQCFLVQDHGLWLSHDETGMVWIVCCPEPGDEPRELVKGALQMYRAANDAAKASPDPDYGLMNENEWRRCRSIIDPLPLMVTKIVRPGMRDAIGVIITDRGVAAIEEKNTLQFQPEMATKVDGMLFRYIWICKNRAVANAVWHNGIGGGWTRERAGTTLVLPLPRMIMDTDMVHTGFECGVTVLFQRVSHSSQIIQRDGCVVFGQRKGAGQ